jgi:hypothetical protein
MRGRRRFPGASNGLAGWVVGQFPVTRLTGQLEIHGHHRLVQSLNKLAHLAKDVLFV